MNLINEEVVHSTFGRGHVKSLENGRIAIEFAEEIGPKSFQYPAAFECYLKMCNPELQGMVEKDLNELLACLAIEKAEKDRKHQENQDRLREERAVIRRAAAKKAAPKKTAAKKVASKVK
ncbi:MAG: hypothetical protein RR131_03765 [Anaerovorax sp.]